MAQRRQRGWLKKESRIPGETWVLYFRTTRKSDGRRVENKIPIGLIRDLPDKRTAWAEVERLHLPINPVDSRRGGHIWRPRAALHKTRIDRANRIDPPQSPYDNKRYDSVLRNRLLPKWGNRIALGIEPLEVEEWLTILKREEELENPTLDRLRRVMSLVYRHGQRYGLIPRTQESIQCATSVARQPAATKP